MRWIGSFFVGVGTAILGVSPFRNGAFNLIDFIILILCIIAWNAIYEFNLHINKIKGKKI